MNLGELSQEKMICLKQIDTPNTCSGGLKCSQTRCDRVALFKGYCCCHAVTDSGDLLENDNREDNLPASNLSEEIPASIEAERRPLCQPNAASEVEFDIDDPPETFREPSKKVTLDPNSQLQDHDVILPRKWGTKSNVVHYLVYSSSAHPTILCLQ